MANSQAAGGLDTWTYIISLLPTKIKKGEVKVALCPTHDMLADFFTKPLQGTLFTWMWDKILNLPCSTSPAVHRSVLDLQNLNMENNEQLINGWEADGEVGPIRDNNNKNGNAPAWKNDDKKWALEFGLDREIMSSRPTD